MKENKLQEIMVHFGQEHKSAQSLNYVLDLVDSIKKLKEENNELLVYKQAFEASKKAGSI